MLFRSLIDRLYLDHNIRAETNLSQLTPEDYPVFDDLYDEILMEFQKTDNAFTRDMLRNLLNYVAKFSTGGRNANIWNGPSTVTTETNFTVFNFQSMLANRNQTIANAQMLLVLKYIDNEIIKNRDYNSKYGLKRKVVVVIDEAHVFIDAKYPIALDFMFQLAKRIRKYNGMQIVITQNIKDFVGSEEIARKSTAIINACQYSFIFALAPNDIQDLVKLYENAGGINESEQEQIVQAPRGQAFTIMSPTSRSTFRVETGESMIHMFEDREFISRYFSDEDGAANWEDFVAGSREAHDEAAMARWDEQFGEEEVSAGTQSSFAFEEYDGEDQEEPESFSFYFGEEDDTPQAEAEPAETALAIAARETAPTGTESMERGVAMDAVMGMFDAMTNKITEAFERVGLPVAPEQDNSVVSENLTAQLAEKDAQLSRKDAELSAKNAEIERLLAEMERLKHSAVETQPEYREEPSTEIAWDTGEEPYAEPETEIDWGKDEELFVEAGVSETKWESSEEDAEIDWDAETGAGEDGVPDVEDEEEDGDLAGLATFLDQSIEHMQSLTFVDRMMREGRSTAEISLSELVKYIEKMKEQAKEIA